MKNKNGFISMTLVYTFLIIFMFIMLAILRTYTEKNKFLQAINDQINNDIGVAKGSRVTVINRILEDNMPSSDISIRYFDISNDYYGNGNGLFYMDKKNYDGYDLNYLTDENADGNTTRIYYFRGNVENNHLIFANMCFRIIRTNEDGSIRIRYNGLPQDGKCKTLNQLESIPSYISIGTSKFSETSTSESNGYEYVKVIDGYVPPADDNNVQSPIIKKLNEWYRRSFVDGVNYTDYISKNAIYCNNKEEYTPTSYFISREISPIFIDSTNLDVRNYSNIQSIITLRCARRNDRFSISDNNILYPVGLLTAQDFALAGAYLHVDEDIYNGGSNNTIENTNYYLYSYSNQWTMSPLSNDGKVIYVDENGTMRGASVTNEYNIIPVISLNSNIVISQGNGQYNNPYIVK